MQTIEGDTYTLYLCAIDEGLHDTRRQREQTATAHLVAAAFGSRARKCNDALGAPYIELDGIRADIQISLSHSRHYAVLAISHSGTRIGVDIEEQRATLARVVRRVCSPAEWQAYNTTPDALLAAWTAKEALFKACRALTGGEVNFATMLRLPLNNETAATYTVNGEPIARYTIHYHTPAHDTLICVAAAQ